MRGLKMFSFCAKTADNEVPAHSNDPLSLETPKVISVGTVEIPISFRKAMKFADVVSNDNGVIFSEFTNDKLPCS